MALPVITIFLEKKRLQFSENEKRSLRINSNWETPYLEEIPL